MNNIKKAIVFFMVIAMIITAVGCNFASKDGSKSNDAEAIEKSGKAGKKALPEKLDNPNISVIYHADFGDVHNEATKLFEEKYGGKLTLIRVGTMNEYPTKLVALLNAGDSPDITFFNNSHVPSFIVNNLVQPVEPFAEFLEENYDVDKQIKYKGKAYGLYADANPTFICFNKTMFENNGVKTPAEYYKEGSWNWESFRTAAMALTQDTNGDGVIDQWGFGSHDLRLFTLANGGDFVEFKDDGGIELTLTSPKTVEALQFLHDAMYKDNYLYRKTNTHLSDFPAGKLAMTIDKLKVFAGETSFQNMKDEWGIVPFPIGPSGDEGVSPADTPSWALCTGAKNPQGAIVWLSMLSKISKEKQDKFLAERYTEEYVELLKKLREKVVFTNSAGVGKINNIMFNKLYPQLAKGVPVLTVIDTITPELQAEIDLILQSGK